MFTFSPKQVSTFTAQAEEDFIDRMVDHIRTRFPKKYSRLGPDTSRRHAEKTCADARGHGFVTERQIVSFLDLGLRYGRFWEQPWASKDLDPDSGPPDRRMRSLQMATLKATGDRVR